MVPVDFSFCGKLNKVQTYLREEINIKPAGFEELVQLEMNELDQTVNPAIVLAVSGSCTKHDSKSEALAGIIQFMFMANKVHRLMKDDADLAEELRQFPVLVGDLLYGKFFLELCRKKLLFFLDPLAQVMGTMSQGGISRWLSRDKSLSRDELLHIIELESASLTGVGARLSAELAGVSLPLQKKLESFGLEMGLAWGAWKERMEMTVVESILQRANAILEDISNESQIEQRPLREVHQYLTKQLSTEYNPQEIAP
ncbi:geranylgeranyl pyrophosphate synthase [Desulfosporosinus sp.]|uniref:geranylgeranyl pyrophosphate synthase n=1 Tax=Desulfosporosinus sp. TaxID=157907 RepID=UPI000E9AA975|nr:geranylgeranyl pyrophosphate synthase [Desulfosporosinus sp.]MBC2721984.1 geranylgeranyl pyrophosphate synthase [Desulfosporosinus sp.]MBC2725000.1 geranylgeranyl pyrophosphate synthase [Desulfosporosinus sp.]HBV86378.1 geranylgeranyl pyrophosphate synthase [Desulfosporosinus sp.]